MTENELIAVVMPGGSIELEWTKPPRPGDKNGESRRLLEKEIYRRYASGRDDWIFYLAFADPATPLSDSLSYFRKFARLFADCLLKTPDLEILRERVEIPADPDQIDSFLHQAPLMTGAEYLDATLLEQTWDRLRIFFSKAIRSHDGTVESFIKTYNSDIHLVGRVFFHLVENKTGDQPFAFLATYSTRLNVEGKSKHLPLKYALTEYEGHREKLLDLLSTVYAAAKESTVLADLLESGDIFHPLAWSAGEAWRFLNDIPLFENAGILCRIPNWWKSRGTGVTVNIQFGDKKPSLLGMDAILNFDIGLVLDNDPISMEEAKQLLEQSGGLAFIKNRWVAVDPEKLKETLAAYEQAQKMINKEGITLQEALRLQLNPKKLLENMDTDADIGVSNGNWLASMIEKLRNPRLISSVSPSQGFKANLRPYQQLGLNWLHFLHTMGFGACLADDMGLGKTVQVLAFLSRIKSDRAKSKQIHPASLLVIPASLISNWETEIKTYAPELQVFIAHPGANPGIDLEKEFGQSVSGCDLVITTYALAGRYPWLQSYPWNYLILDEAQAIKNPGTRQAKAIKKYMAKNRIVMTGTPIENRLSDLWSLFDFLNPGLLGNAAEFKKFTKTIDRDQTGYSRLRNLIRPYILRRLKTDKTVISDLPDKVEMKTYAHLTKKQALLYQQLVEDIEKTISEKDGMERKGLILSSLMRLKQLCNHPDQYLGTQEYMEEASGKFLRLREICETIFEKREKALIFTQFKEIIGPLSEFLESIFQRKGLVIHGSIPVGKRKQIISDFQQKTYVPFLVCSLKAGGVGLNLTEANHVIHFDRWWNPAVENQATDRAFRIGQKKNVVVHKFITKGTVEEKIDRMLEEKTTLVNDVVATANEAWITEMDNEKIVELFRLSL
jgi:hypothetical protein